MSGPRDQAVAKFSNAASQRLGLPQGYQTYSPFPFAGVNQKDARFAIGDNEFYWLENFIKIGNGYLRTVWDKSTTPIYAATGGRTVVFFYFYNIGPTDYCAVFLDDGTAIQVDTNTLAQTVISSTAATFYDPTTGTFPACVQWGTQYLLISNNNTPNDYWIWDGSLLYATGTLGPVVTITGGGYNYSSAPTLTFYGGSPSTAPTATTTLDNGSVALVSLTNPGNGYGINDLPQVAFSGGGTDTGAILTANLAPGTVENIVVTAPGSGYHAGVVTVTISGGGGSGATAVVTDFTSPAGVKKITITNAGSGYTSAPTVTINANGFGNGAKAFAQVSAGAVQSVTVVNGGSGYTYPPTLTFIGGGGTDADGYAKLTGTQVASIHVSEGGSYGGNTPAVNLVGGGGSGAAAHAVMQANDKGENSVKSVVVDAPGSGYTYPPAVTFQFNAPGGTDGGAKAQAVLVGTSIASVVMNNQGQNYSNPPAVVITPGANNAAYATVELMPFGISGNGIEAFQSRVWLTHPKEKSTSYPPQGGNMDVSEPSSLTSFNPGAGAVLFTNTGSVLRKVYNGIRQSNGYLYPFGDSSVDVISNVNTSGDPATTTFNYQNTDPQTGTAFRDSLQPFSRTILFANTKGVFGLYGGAVTRVSDKLNNLFDLAQFPPTSNALRPSSASVHHHNVKLYLLLLTITDPFTLQPRDVLLAWDEKDWYVLSQTGDLNFIGTQIVESDLRAYGTDGSTIFRLFTTPSEALEKVVSTKLYGAQTHSVTKQVFNVTYQGQDLSSDSTGAVLSGVFNSEQGDTPVAHNADISAPKVFTARGADVYANFLGLTLGSTSKDFALYNMSIGYTDFVGPLGSGQMNAPASE